MPYDFSLALAVMRRELAPYHVLREAQVAGVQVETFEEALAWKRSQQELSPKGMEKN